MIDYEMPFFVVKEGRIQCVTSCYQRLRNCSSKLNNVNKIKTDMIFQNAPYLSVNKTVSILTKHKSKLLKNVIRVVSEGIRSLKLRFSTKLYN